ncbi:MAG: hypothetical protein JW939_09725 [Candidatus Thermoplasmatota archaeon]|nr:hypothetical protein [Candidatus Thermoplasmatota archaeon]
MEEVGLDRSRLLSVRGMGEGKLDSILRHLGGEQGLQSALAGGNVSLISSVDGISQRMAVELVLSFKGLEPGHVMGTEASRQVYGSIMEILREHMHTETSRNRALLLVPGGDLREDQRSAEEVHSFRYLLEGRDRALVEELLGTVSKRPVTRTTRRKDPYILLVEDEEAYQGIRRKGLDSTCLVITPDELSSGLEGDVIYVYSRRELDEELLPMVVAVHHSSPDHEIVPERSMDGILPQLERIKAVSGLRSLFGEGTVCGRAVEVMDELSALSHGPLEPDEVRKKVEEIRIEVETSLKAAISGLTLSGEDTLSILSSGETLPLRDIYRQHARMAVDRILGSLGVKKDLFRMRYPLEVDHEALESMILGMKEKAAMERFRRKVELACELASLRDEIMTELDWAVDLDWKWGLGTFVEDLALAPFEVCDGYLALKGASDLQLRRHRQYQKVDYHLGAVPAGMKDLFPRLDVSDSRTAMLTGANSGGKTTLLMTIAQVLIMARMGLPVPAERAFLPDIDKVFIYKPGRRLDAGGLEEFLKELLPLSMKIDGSSIVLADELEAMTELEAASRIIGVFLEELSSRGAYSVVVTHMAAEIGNYTGCRVDGIEARGLDDKHNLIVDRTPVIGLYARSTPELILKKLLARASGDEKEIYEKVLKSFQSGG